MRGGFSAICKHLNWVLKSILRAVTVIVVAMSLLSPFASAQIDEAAREVGSYRINAGDVLSLQVWNEPSLSSEQFSVRPDGFVSIPVVGELQAGQKTIAELQALIAEGLSRYLKDAPTVVVSILASNGNLVYVLGKVGRPGAFPINGPMDVTQALAFAGGLNSFAAENKIKILRRDKNGVQKSIRFKYGQVKDGDKLETNILLQSGDVVLVP
ncbi:MAG: polysaccharide biosynthesis/export family protein [Pseudomonadales bacterium]